MSAIGSKIMAIALVGAAILSTAVTAQAAPAPVSGAAASVTEDAPETPEQRRQRLNARMAEMVRSGEGARLVQPTAPTRPRASAPRRAPNRAPAPARAAPVSPPPVAAAPDTGADDLFRSTIAPPAYRGAPERPRGRGYTPPTLDLSTAPRIPNDAVECLTQAIYYEARNESEEGQAAVAQVVVNRSLSGAYPSDICQVVYQRNSRTCQFTFTCDGAIGRSPIDMVKWARAERIARDVHEGRSADLLPRESVNYHATYVSPSWSRRLERVRQIGAHIFYGAALGGGVTPGAALRAAAPPVRSGLTFVRSAALDAAYERAQAAEVAPQAEPAVEQP